LQQLERIFALLFARIRDGISLTFVIFIIIFVIYRSRVYLFFRSRTQRGQGEGEEIWLRACRG
jgi:hypothetical protein